MARTAVWTSVVSSRTGYVTLRSTTGQGATLSPSFFGNTNHFIRLQSLTINRLEFGGGGTSCPRHLAIVGNSFGTSQFLMRVDVCDATAVNMLIEGNTFGAYVSSGGLEGTLMICCDNAPGAVPHYCGPA